MYVPQSSHLQNEETSESQGQHSTHTHQMFRRKGTYSNDVGAVDHIVAIVLSVNAISSDESTPEPPTACGPD